MRGVTELTELLAELAADAQEAIDADRVAEAARARVRAKLPLARSRGAGPRELERTIQSLYVERTIARWTAGDAPAAPAKRHRKRPGAAPSAQS
jgi:hypothetical protein